MKFLRSVKQFSVINKILNDQIRTDLNIFSINVRIEHLKQNWKERHQRMQETVIFKMGLNYETKARRALCRQLKRWK